MPMHCCYVGLCILSLLWQCWVEWSGVVCEVVMNFVMTSKEFVINDRMLIVYLVYVFGVTKNIKCLWYVKVWFHIGDTWYVHYIICYSHRMALIGVVQTLIWSYYTEKSGNFLCTKWQNSVVRRTFTVFSVQRPTYQPDIWSLYTLTTHVYEEQLIGK